MEASFYKEKKAYPLYTHPKNYDIIVMVGIPLSGKSTFSKAFSKKYGYVVLCPDNVRLAMHGHQFIHSAEPFVWATVDTMARTFLIQGEKIIVDATNTHVNARGRWLKLAKEFDKSIAALVMDTPFEVSFFRNEEIQRLDSSVLDRMQRQYEFPSKYENFDGVFTVKYYMEYDKVEYSLEYTNKREEEFLIKEQL